MRMSRYIYINKVGDAAGTDFTGDVRCIARLKDGTLIVKRWNDVLTTYVHLTACS